MTATIAWDQSTCARDSARTRVPDTSHGERYLLESRASLYHVEPPRAEASKHVRRSAENRYSSVPFAISATSYIILTRFKLSPSLSPSNAQICLSSAVPMTRNRLTIFATLAISRVSRLLFFYGGVGKRTFKEYAFYIEEDRLSIVIRFSRNYDIRAHV